MTETVLEDWLDHELRNWSRWCKSGALPHPLPLTRAASAEGRYLSESVFGVEVDQDEAARRAPPANAERAEKVQKVYLDRLTRNERQALVVTYIKPFPKGDEVRAKRAGLSTIVFQTALLSAGRQVGRAFTPWLRG
jgi:hypothetical protein